jgi:hypothetical protein
MPTASLNKVLSIGGREFRSTRAPSSSGRYERGSPTTQPAAKAGTLTVRTDDDTGTATMSGGHGLTTGRMDVYWAHTDGTRRVRYGMTGTVTGDSVALDGGAGDILPAAATAVTVTKPNQYDFVAEFANLKALGVGCENPAVAVFLDDADAVVAAIPTTGTGGDFSWDSGDSAANPFDADVASVWLSQGGTDAARPVDAIALID